MKPTLGQVFALSLLGLVATLALLFAIVFRASRETIVESSERLRDQAAREVGSRVTGFLAEAPARVRQFQSEIASGLVDARDPAALEAALFALLLSDRNLGELSLTYGEMTGFDPGGEILLADAPRGEFSVSRGLAGGGEQLWSRHVHREGGAFVADRREFRPGTPLEKLAVAREKTGALSDPTEHPTFKTPASKDFQGQLLPSDLHWSQLDAELPEPKRRVEVSVQQTVVDSAGEFLGVFRVGLLTEQLDRAAQLRLAPPGEADPHRIFICDARGRLITRLTPADRLQESGDDLRVAPASLPPEVVAALGTSMLAAITEKSPGVSGQFHDHGEDFLATFRALPETQDWIVGIVVPRAFYLGKLTAIRNRLLGISLGLVVLVVAAGGFILRAVRRAQAQIVAESAKMNAFEFSPAPTASAFRDVSEILEGLEKAKAAMRAMGKYAPIDLVRRLYREKSEPVLGGEEKEISIMFTDIKDFTTLSEQLAPNELAAALGRYLEVMARIIQQETRGTIDKYIGDAIMTLWNAPEPVAEHALMACRAALRCRDAGRALAQAPEWRGLPPFETRFGLHRDTALVGHFGAPDRMNYTAIGDAINLASRLEGLNKQYGTTIIASERIVESAGAHFAFRLLDLVAVKGKNEAIKIYELLGELGADSARAEVVTAYEEAFAAYLARDFSKAIAILERQNGDEPSQVLCARCRALLREPPPADWRGVYVSKSK
jgi:adenylate cyclase